MDYCSGSGLGNGGCPPGAYRAYVAIQGPMGDTGPTGPQGETPTVTVAEDTPVSYKLNFKTSDQDMTTPNLLAPFTEYHVDLSAADSTLSVPLKDLVLIY